MIGVGLPAAKDAAVIERMTELPVQYPPEGPAALGLVGKAKIVKVDELIYIYSSSIVVWQTSFVYTALRFDIAAPLEKLTTAARGEPSRGCLGCPNYFL